MFCRTRCGESSVDMGFERGLVVEPAFSKGSPKCRAFSTLIELTQAGKPNEFELKSLVERCVTHIKFCIRMYETQRNAGRLFLHEHPWDA